MIGRPSPNGANGRDGRGRFVRGNAGGPGNPEARRTADFRRLVLDAATDRFPAVVSKLFDLAESGEPWAVREVLDRVLGKPTAALEQTTPEPECHPVRITYTTMTPEQQNRIDELAKIGLAKLALDDDSDDPTSDGGRGMT